MYYEIRFNGGNWTNVGLNLSSKFNLTDGNYTIEVRAVDGNANGNTTTTSFIIDTIAPSLTITNPKTGSTLKSKSVTVTWEGSDTGSGLARFEIRIDGGTWDNMNTATSHTFSGLSDGFHWVKVRAIDGTRRGTTDTVAFTINTSLFGGPGLLEELMVGMGAAIGILVLALLVLIKKRKD